MTEMKQEARSKKQEGRNPGGHPGPDPGRETGGSVKFPLPASRSPLPICLLLILIISAGCATPPAPVQRPAGAPFETGKLKERSDFWRDYQCKFRLMVDSKTAKFSSRAIVIVKGRDFVRFETFTPFGQTAALYVSNEAGPSLLIPSEKVIFTAQSPETLVREFLGVTLPVDIFRCALTASVPLSRLGNIESRPDAGVWRLISNGEGAYFEWRITAGSPALEGAFVRSAEFEGRVSYDPPVGIAKETVPGKIRISSSEWNMEIVIEELMPVSQFQPSAFYLPNLPGARKVDLDKIK